MNNERKTIKLERKPNMAYYTNKLKIKKGIAGKVTGCEKYLQNVDTGFEYNDELAWLNRLSKSCPFYYSDLITSYVKITSACITTKRDVLYGKLCFVEVLDYCCGSGLNYRDFENIIKSLSCLMLFGSLNYSDQKNKFDSLTKRNLTNIV